MTEEITRLREDNARLERQIEIVRGMYDKMVAGLRELIDGMELPEKPIKPGEAPEEEVICYAGENDRCSNYDLSVSYLRCSVTDGKPRLKENYRKGA